MKLKNSFFKESFSAFLALSQTKGLDLAIALPIIKVLPFIKPFSESYDKQRLAIYEKFANVDEKGFASFDDKKKSDMAEKAFNALHKEEFELKFETINVTDKQVEVASENVSPLQFAALMEYSIIKLS